MEKKEVREERDLVKENEIGYNVFMDPDVELMDSDGNFPSEYKSFTSNGGSLLFLIFLVIAVLLVIVIGEIHREKNSEVVELKPVVSSSVNIVEVFDVVDASKLPNVTGLIMAKEEIEDVKQDFIRVQEGELATRKDQLLKPYLIDYYDYAPYNAGNVGLKTVMNEIGYDSPKLLVSTFYNGIIDVVASNNLYRMHKENGAYTFFLYLPKKESEITVDEKFAYLNTFSCGGDTMYAITLLHGKDMVGEIPLSIHIKYLDGQETDFILHITKEYV